MIETLTLHASLFGATWCTLLALASLLALVGVPALARDQIFVGIAVSQTAMLGIGLVLVATYTTWGYGRDWLQSPLLPPVVGAVLAAGALMALDWRTRSRSSKEARIGWLYLAASSATVVLLFHTPVGLQELHARQASSVIGATWLDSGLAAAMLVLGLALYAVGGDRIRLWMLDPTMAAAVGLRVRRYRWGYACCLGAALALAIHSGGLLVAFGFLILPTMAAAGLCRGGRWLFLVAPLLALLASVGGIALSLAIDLPIGPSAVAVMALLVPATHLIPRPRLTPQT